VVQWVKIHLPMQGTQIPSLAQEDPQAVEQLSPCTTSTEPACCEYGSACAQSLCSTTREAMAMISLRNAKKSSPHLPQLEKARIL